MSISIGCSNLKCGKPNASKVCSKCRNSYYCDVICQRADFPRHKVICTAENAERNLTPFKDLSGFLEKHATHRRTLEIICSRKACCAVFLIDAQDSAKADVFELTPEEVVARWPIFAEKVPLFKNCLSNNFTMAIILNSDGTYFSGALRCV